LLSRGGDMLLITVFPQHSAVASEYVFVCAEVCTAVVCWRNPDDQSNSRRTSAVTRWCYSAGLSPPASPFSHILFSNHFHI